MFFLLRMTFWLGLAFAAIEWPADAPAIPGKAAVAEAATSAAASYCARNTQSCQIGRAHV